MRIYCKPVPPAQKPAMSDRFFESIGTVKNQRRFNDALDCFQLRKGGKRSDWYPDSILLYISGLRGGFWSVYCGPQSQWNRKGCSSLGTTALSSTIEGFITSVDLVKDFLEEYNTIDKIVFVTDQDEIQRALTDYDYVLGADIAPTKSMSRYKNELTHIHYEMLALANTGVACKIWHTYRDALAPAMQLASTHADTSDSSDSEAYLQEYMTGPPWDPFRPYWFSDSDD